MSRLAFRGRITAPSDLLSCLELLITSRNSSLIRPNHARLPPRPVRLARTTHLPRCCNFVKTSLRLTWTSAVPRTRNHSSLPLALPLSLPCLGSNQGRFRGKHWGDLGYRSKKYGTHQPCPHSSWTWKGHMGSNKTCRQVLGRNIYFANNYKDQQDRIGKICRFTTSLDPFSL